MPGSLPPPGTPRAVWWDRPTERWRAKQVAQWQAWHGGELPTLSPHPRAPVWVRIGLPVVLSLLLQLPPAVAGLRFDLLATGAVSTRSAVILAVSIAGGLALLFARRFPGPVVVVVAVLGSVDILLAHNGPPYLALAFAIGSAVIRGARIWAWVAVSVCWIATIVVALVFELTSFTPFQIAGVTLFILIVMGVAEGIRGRREATAQFRRMMRDRQQSEVQAERVRIARELHDVLAHSLSQINVQAGVGLHLMERQPEKAADALQSIKETSKNALDEVRAVLGVLRAEGGADPTAPLVPEPDLSRLPGLVAVVASDDLQVELDDRLEPGTPQAVQLALYRIVQESLTNITRHSDARHATVRLWESADSYRLEVRDTGSGTRPAGPSVSSGGRGLLGMHERAELLGGSLTATPSSSGGFVVDASIPLHPRTPDRQETA